MKSTSLDAAILEICVSAAVAAPSIHNTQPWRFRLDPVMVTFQVFAAPERGLRHTDPTGRALYLSAGAGVFNLRVALAHFGWAPVTRLLPCPENPGLFATVRPTESGDSHQGRQSLDLYAAIWRRRRRQAGSPSAACRFSRTCARNSARRPVRRAHGSPSPRPPRGTVSFG